MQSHDYRVVPAPRRPGRGSFRARGTAADRFAQALEAEMNRMAAEGWEFVRADTLPREQGRGWLRAPQVVHETVLVFRRALPEAEGARERPAAAPAPTTPAPAMPAPAAPAPRAARAPDAPRFLRRPQAPAAPPVLPAAASPAAPPPALPPLVAARPAEPAPPAPTGPRLAAP